MNHPYIACAQKRFGSWLCCDRVHNKAKCQWCGHTWSHSMSHNPVLGTKRKTPKQRTQWAKWNFPKVGVQWPSFREVLQTLPGLTGPTRKKPEGRQRPQLSSTLAQAWHDLPEDVQAKFLAAGFVPPPEPKPSQHDTLTQTLRQHIDACGCTCCS